MAASTFTYLDIDLSVYVSDMPARLRAAGPSGTEVLRLTQGGYMNQLSDRKVLEPGEPPPDAAAYDADFALWSERQAHLLRHGRLNELDRENLIGELEAMGSSQRQELESRLIVLLTHLLKCQFQPMSKSSSWIGTLDEQRTQIAILIKNSPSLARLVMPYADDAYPPAVRRAANQTGLSKITFPLTNPYSCDQLLDPDFVP